MMGGEGGTKHRGRRTPDGWRRRGRTLLALGLVLCAAGAAGLARPLPAAAALTSGFSVKDGSTWTTTARVPLGDQGYSPFFRPGVIVFDGGSILGGLRSAEDDAPPARSLDLIPRTVRSYLSITQAAKIVDMLQQAPTEVDVHYDPEGDANVCVAMPGGSDLANGADIEDLLESTRQYCTERRAAGFAVVVVTLLPRLDSDFEAVRLEFNERLRTHWREFADGLADIGADSRIGDTLDCYDLKYYRADAEHPNAAGNAVIASVIAPAVNGLAWRSNDCEMRLRNGDEEWTEWHDYSARAVWTLSPNDGVKKVFAEYRYQGTETVALDDSIRLDTVGPSTYALRDVRVRHGRRAVLPYRVIDPEPGSSTARVSIVITTRSGYVMKRLALGKQAAGADLKATFTCLLPRGRYNWRVTARDAAGNLQTQAGRAALRVR